MRSISLVEGGNPFPLHLSWICVTCTYSFGLLKYSVCIGSNVIFGSNIASSAYGGAVYQTTAGGLVRVGK